MVFMRSSKELNQKNLLDYHRIQRDDYRNVLRTKLFMVVRDQDKTGVYFLSTDLQTVT